MSVLLALHCVSDTKAISAGRHGYSGSGRGKWIRAVKNARYHDGIGYRISALPVFRRFSVPLSHLRHSKTRLGVGHLARRYLLGSKIAAGNVEGFQVAVEIDFLKAFPYAGPRLNERTVVVSACLHDLREGWAVRACASRKRGNRQNSKYSHGFLRPGIASAGCADFARGSL